MSIPRSFAEEYRGLFTHYKCEILITIYNFENVFNPLYVPLPNYSKPTFYYYVIF